MEDKCIVDLYVSRDERAIAESESKYGRYCLQVAMNILDNHQDAEECVNDAFLRAWNAIPPEQPVKLGAYLAKITRNLSLDRFKAAHTAKRGQSQFLVSLDELSECIPAGGFEGNVEAEAESARVGMLINDFLHRTKAEAREVFICRYFYSETIGEIARRYGLTESKVKTILYRTRNKLRKYLESEGVRI